MVFVCYVFYFEYGVYGEVVYIECVVGGQGVFGKVLYIDFIEIRLLGDVVYYYGVFEDIFYIQVDIVKCRFDIFYNLVRLFGDIVGELFVFICGDLVR